MNRQIIFLGQGRHRAVFDLGRGWVLKVPIEDYGLTANWFEDRRYKQYGRSGFIPFARCRMLPNGCLLMEKVKPMKSNFPKWADWVDCRQVGMARDGAIVAYDYETC